MVLTIQVFHNPTSIPSTSYKRDLGQAGIRCKVCPRELTIQTTCGKHGRQNRNHSPHVHSGRCCGPPSALGHCVSICPLSLDSEPVSPLPGAWNSLCPSGALYNTGVPLVHEIYVCWLNELGNGGSVRQSSYAGVPRCVGGKPGSELRPRSSDSECLQLSCSVHSLPALPPFI